jgi:hypothetical protein
MMILQSSRGVLSSGGFDPMAARYLKAVETAGATVTSTQRTAINDFFKTGRSQGWISSLRRMYLPIWGAAAPNAIDMRTIASGTFIGGVTHASSYVQSNGSTGYMSMGTSPSAQGLTASSSFLFTLVQQAESRTGAAFTIVGASNSISRNSISHISFNNQTALFSSSVSSYMLSPDNMNRAGIFYGGTTANNARYLRVRRTAGVQNAGSNTTLDNTPASTSSMGVMARVVDSTPSEYSNARIGAAGMGLGLSTANSDAFSAALKTLWETCTGLTLP